jgi:DNA-binding GntR family transcriptional regulator
MSGVIRREPPYVQMIEHFRREILSGRLKEGDRLPTARELQREYGVSLTTAAKVAGGLQALGLVTSRVGVGSVVAIRPPDGSASHIPAIRLVGLAWPSGADRILDAGLVSCPQRVAEALGVGVRTRVIRRRRVTIAAKAPVAASTSWFPATLKNAAPALLEATELSDGTDRYIEQAAGRTAVRCEDTLSAALAGGEVATDLAVEPGSPVLTALSRLYDTDDVVLEYRETALPLGAECAYTLTLT